MEDKFKKLGKTLRELRILNKLSFRETDRLSGVDISTISRLEEGKVNRINPFTLNKLAKAYKTNPLHLFRIIDCISEEDIKQYINVAKNENTSVHNNEIEVFNEYCNSYYPKKFIKVPGVECNAIEIKNHIFLYDNNCVDLINDDLGLFDFNNEIVIAFHYYLNNITTLKNYFTEKVSMHEDIKIIGKVKGLINLSYSK